VFTTITNNPFYDVIRWSITYQPTFFSDSNETVARRMPTTRSPSENASVTAWWTGATGSTRGRTLTTRITLSSLRSSPRFTNLRGRQCSHQHQPGVNFINNILRAVFCSKVFGTAFMCLEFLFVIFRQNKISPKAAHKMLVKLITVRRRYQSVITHTNWMINTYVQFVFPYFDAAFEK